MRQSNPHSDPMGPIPIPLHRQTQTNLFTAFSIKADKLLQFESAWEYRFFLLCESDPDIIRLCPQPYKIDTKVDGKKLNYTFDMWLCWKDAYREYIEVKPLDRCAVNESGQLLPEKWPQIELWARHQKPPVNIRHVSDLYINEHCDTIRKWDQILPFVQRAHQQDVSGIKERVLHRLKHKRQDSLQDLIHLLPDKDENDVISVCMHLIHENECHANLSNSLFNKDLVIHYGEKTTV